MSRIFLPSCTMKRRYPWASSKIREYLERTQNVVTVGCCKAACNKIHEDDDVVLICNDCAAIMEESSKARRIEFVWEIVDRDENFAFPDYHGEPMTIQDCWRAHEKRSVQEAIRSVLRKMNIAPVELEDSFEKTRYCGADLLKPYTETDLKYAPRRYVLEGGSMFTPMSEEAKDKVLKDHCSGIATEKVVCYCPSCLDGINRGGKKGYHLLDLLFPSAKPDY